MLTNIRSCLKVVTNIQMLTRSFFSKDLCSLNENFKLRGYWHVFKDETSLNELKNMKPGSLWWWNELQVGHS